MSTDRCQTGKVSYPTMDDALRQLGNDTTMHAYHCVRCCGYHLGHASGLPRSIPPMSAKQNRELNRRRRSHA